MIGVCIPARDEAALIGGCLTAVARAAAHPALAGEAVRVVVVADACTDATAALARRAGARVEVSTSGCVGAARRTGSAVLLAGGARWLAATDADSEPAPDWLARQLALARAGWDAVCGVVEPDGPLHPGFARGYRDQDLHRHIHGANLGVSAGAYRAAGGFRTVPTGEDVLLVTDLVTTGARVAWSGQVRVRTSGRLTGRAPAGFAADLARLATG